MGRSTLTGFISEKSTPDITFTILDKNSAGFKPETLTLTLYDESADTIINSRDAQNVLDLNNVTVDVSGNLVWDMQILDNPIIDSTKALERHIALWQWTWNSGVDSDYHELILIVQEIHRVT